MADSPAPASKKRTPVAEPLLPPEWDTPQAFRDRLGDDVGRQRLMTADGHLLLVLHAPPRPDEPYRRGRLFWREPGGVWTPPESTEDEHAIGGLIGEYEAMADELDEADGSGAAADYFETLTALGPLVRSAHNLYGVLKEARKEATDCRTLILLRDRAYNLVRRLELMQQDAKNTLDFLIARRAEEQAESARTQAKAAHRLNVLVALFLPLATLAGLFGAELRNGLEAFDAANAPGPFLTLAGVGLGLGVVTALFITRK